MVKVLRVFTHGASESLDLEATLGYKQATWVEGPMVTEWYHVYRTH